jgi:hypothetical protein
VDRTQGPGHYQVRWDGKSNSGRVAGSGAYFCRIVADEFSAIKKMTMMK